jgi:23S rRNA (adenine2503-C2)-methyltransferase
VSAEPVLFNQPAASAALALKPLIGLTQAQLVALVQEMGEPAFRGEQLHHWIYVRCVRSFDEMTNLAKAFRARLKERFTVGALTLHTKEESADGTVKYLFKLPDGRVVESVLMYFQERETYAMCISSQVGCAVDCSFCATGKLGFTRHLSVGEIVEQYVYVQGDSGKEVRNIVFMGQGEPLLNFDNVVAAIEILNTSAEVGMRRMTVSTAGIVPKIYRLAECDLPITLAISLHAPDNETRNEIMPINRKWPLEELIPALHHYVNTTGRRLTVEYIMIDGLNDSAEHAHRLGQLLKGLKCNVNLIPYNPISQDLPGVPAYRRSSRSAIETFKTIVYEHYGKKVTVRLERGTDIAAACGQLANKVVKSESATVGCDSGGCR